MFINKVRFEDDTAIIAKTQEELQDMMNRLVDTGRKYVMKINITNCPWKQISYELVIGMKVWKENGIITTPCFPLKGFEILNEVRHGAIEM